MQLNPKKWKFAVLVWLAIYPLISLIMIFLGPVLMQIAVPLRTLLITFILVPTMVYAIIPSIQTNFHDWLRK